MKRFSYQAIDSRGKTVDGFMEAGTSDEVGVWLIDRNLHVLNISESPISALKVFTSRPTRLSVKEMNYFLHQLSGMLNAGCPLVSCLRALHLQLSPGNLKLLIAEIEGKIETGKSFSDALKAFPDIFPNLFITMVEVGEIGGILDEVLERYAQIYDYLYRIRSKIFRSMIYPALLLFLTITVAWALLIWVFPVFIEQIQVRGGALPGPTQMVLSMSQLLQNFSDVFFYAPRLLPLPPLLTFPPFFAGVCLAFYHASLSLFRQTFFRDIFDSLLLKTPAIGTLVHYSELALFTRTLGTLIKCGVPILTSLAAVEKAHSNQKFKYALAEIREGISRGESLSAGMSRRRDLFPESLILMVDVGERGGNVGILIDKAAQFYERDLENTIETVVSLVEPLLVIFLALFVVLLALAMYLPLFDIIKMVR